MVEGIGAISRRAAAMARTCGLDGVDAAILLCSLLSLKGEEIEQAIYSRRIKNELYEDAKRLVGRSGDVGAMLSRATECARAEAREISAMELFCLLGLETSLAELYQDKGLNRGMLNDLLASCRSSQGLTGTVPAGRARQFTRQNQCPLMTMFDAH